MSEKETVEVTFKLPKRLLDLLENENYFGLKKKDFYVAAVKTMMHACSMLVSEPVTRSFLCASRFLD